MNAEKQRIAIAEACGWHRVKDSPYGISSAAMEYDSRLLIPDYLNDLNAMHEAEKALKADDLLHVLTYVRHLAIVMRESDEALIGTIHATATQRAEAFLRTIGKWEDG